MAVYLPCIYRNSRVIPLKAKQECSGKEGCTVRNSEAVQWETEIHGMTFDHLSVCFLRFCQKCRILSPHPFPHLPSAWVNFFINIFLYTLSMRITHNLYICQCVRVVLGPSGLSCCLWCWHPLWSAAFSPSCSASDQDTCQWALECSRISCLGPRHPCKRLGLTSVFLVFAWPALASETFGEWTGRWKVSVTQKKKARRI